MKKFLSMFLLLALVFVTGGCSQNQQELLHAYLKMQDITSAHEHITISFNLSGSGFDPVVQERIDQTAAYLNNAQLDLDIKTVSNKAQTVNKSLITTDLALQGLEIKVPCWLDMDLEQATPKFLEIVQVPQFAASSLPPRFATKEYLIINPLDPTGAGQTIGDPANLVKFIKEFKSKQTAFLTSYAGRFNPDINLVNKGQQSVQTDNGQKQAQVYELNLDDAQFKQLLSYTANNFLQDEEAVAFVKDYLLSSLSLSQSEANEKQLNTIKQTINEFDPQVLLAVFNQAMDELQEVTVLGDDGLKLQFALADGYLIQTNGSFNLKLDSSQLAQPFTNSGEEEITTGGTMGTVNLTMNWRMDLSDINSSFDISIPSVDDSNSFPLQELMYSLIGPTRLSGDDRFQTAKLISEQFHSGTVQDVIVTSGRDFPDALSASVLARKLDAPILLAGSSAEDWDEATAYISQHLDQAGTVHIIGGNNAVPSELEQNLSNLGFTVDRIAGQNRMDTNLQIAQKLNASPNTPLIIASARNFPDVLSICSIAAHKGYPILFVDKDSLTQGVQDYIQSVGPSQIYIIGGTGMISETNQAQIQALTPDCTVTRLAGEDRYDTAGKILAEFSSNPRTIYLASGNNFPDALAGSVLASATGDPIILVDSNSSELPPAIATYLTNLYDHDVYPQIISLGGRAAVPEAILDQVVNILKGMTR